MATQVLETRDLPRDWHCAVLAQPCSNETFDFPPNTAVVLRSTGYVEVDSTTADGGAFLRYRTPGPARGMEAPDGALVEVHRSVLALFPARAGARRAVSA
jgi:hypothetical protein